MPPKTAVTNRVRNLDLGKGRSFASSAVDSPYIPDVAAIQSFSGTDVTIRGNSYRMRRHTELWHTLHNQQEPEAAPNRRRRRQEATTN